MTTNLLQRSQEFLAEAKAWEKRLTELNSQLPDARANEIPRALRATALRIRERHMRERALDLFDAAKEHKAQHGGDAAEAALAVGNAWLEDGRIGSHDELIELVYRAANGGGL